MSTESNLKDAFAGESQANRKYLAFSKKAREEGFEQIARLFRAAAESETIHALNHLRILGVGDTKKNLADAVEGGDLRVYRDVSRLYRGGKGRK